MMTAKRRIRHAAIWSFVLLSLLPGLVLLSTLCGWRVTLLREPVGLSLETAALLILTIMAGEPDRTDRVFASLLPFMALAVTLFRFYLDRWIPFLLYMLADLLCAWITFARFAGPRAVKIAFGSLSAVLLAVLLYISPALFLGFTIGVDTVVQSVPSPDGTQIVRVIDSDQGALGGDTIVEVCRGSADFLLFRVEDAERVYSGPWGEFRDMEVFWKDNETISVNGTPRKVPR